MNVSRQGRRRLPRCGVFGILDFGFLRAPGRVLVAAGLLSGAWGATAPEFVSARKPDYVQVPKGATYRFGYVDVPERHANPEGPQIKIAVLILKARSGTPLPDPVFYFVGGPGGPARGAAFAPVFTALNATRDVVLPDTRGCGLSQPNLHFQFQNRSSWQRLRANRRAFRARGIDLGAFNAAEMAQDYESVRLALGYGKINVFGGSFGTFVGQEFIRRFPASLRSIVLSGNLAASNDLAATFLRTTMRGLNAFLDDVETNAAARRDFPDFRARFYALLKECRARPRELVFRDDEGRERRVAVTADALLNAVIGMLTHPATSSLAPLLVVKVERADPSGIVRTLFLPSDQPERPADDSDGAYFSIFASSFAGPDFVRAGDRAVRRLPNRVVAAIKGPEFRRGNRQTVAWGVPYDPGTTRQLPRGDVRVLLLNGAFDTQTADTAGAVIARGLPNATNYVYPRVGHGAGVYPGPDMEAVLAFVRDPSTPPPYRVGDLRRANFYLTAEPAAR